MPINQQAYQSLIATLADKHVSLVAVSKTKPVEDIEELFALGQRDFGENYVQELVAKAAQLPADIRWHFIGHLQTNKVKYIVPIVYLVHGVDSLKLLKEINKQAAKHGRVIDCLLQVFIAQEETKFGMDADELEQALRESANLPHVHVKGLMGMASNSDDKTTIREEFRQLHAYADRYFSAGLVKGLPEKPILSMGMTSDYEMAIEEGSTLVRIGSLLFGQRVSHT